MNDKPNISVLIPTYNRADILNETLQNMERLDKNGLSVEFVVIDNNSSDHTKSVVDSFKDSLGPRYIFEQRPGKNCALNKALNNVEMGEIIAFTDDDVSPSHDWLRVVWAVCKRWPDYYVFGGDMFGASEFEILLWDLVVPYVDSTLLLKKP